MKSILSLASRKTEKREKKTVIRPLAKKLNKVLHIIREEKQNTSGLYVC